MELLKTLLIVATLSALMASKCKKDTVGNPVDQLPAATQTGANTFGCLVNGQVFLPGDVGLGTSPIKSNYQYLGNRAGGGYFFGLAATYGHSSSVTSITIGTDSLAIYEGGRFALETDKKSTASAGYYTASQIQTGGTSSYFGTAGPRYVGELVVTHLDPINQIVSGTFWFNAVGPDGDSVRVTDGRFDTRYTR